MPKRILITGGAGFVGSHLADELLREGYQVRVLDNLTPQVHEREAQRPDYLSPEVEFVEGDIRDPDAVWRALHGIDAVYHFAASVGVGQSMYQIESYTTVNCTGTAILLEALAKRPVQRLVVASSMSIYGEGLYRDSSGREIGRVERTLEQLKRRDWEVREAASREPLVPIPTPETKCPSLPSVYAISKYHQERMCMTVGRAYGIPAVGLRFFNIFGTRQALSNPYTGVLAIFASRLLNNKPPLINEDGLQKRDFVSVHDVARACRLALETTAAEGHVFNVGSGMPHSVLEIARTLGRILGKEHIEPEITGKYRIGDIRNCFADISLARQVLGYEPKVGLEEGLQEISGWLEGRASHDRLADASRELSLRGLTI